MEETKMARTVVVTPTTHKVDDALRGKLMVTPQALAALERQAQREGMTLGELVGCLLEKVASQLLIEESVLSIQLGKPRDADYLLIEKGFDIGGGDA